MKSVSLAFILSAAMSFTALGQTSGQPGSSGRYMGGLLDHRSRYGEFWFPEPLRGPEMDVDREFRVDWFHGEKRGVQQDEVTAELEYNIGLLTLEAEVPYERES